ncbi:P-loop containing nucleoside triphosphate hydrolase protein [Aaosphaeria arxii CBS 175.79]|uniref:P-loop containing nucleoside triphosphate hydrolase protein n=1 Tax=Aaosphaeria arxii CBS 175.79 TaxID=1450172 RepID=A0A6A5XF66_9PLEO|nr:P-loop containing nucleoside triphosphate hydrolase protein [Aaosphaeria arxii CBS 175.79]KAF2011722.1 P-loop containing nucleoside triphosphate hydrolase protein [Aaosphaeria arxii CBS 175.79]
MAPGQPSKRPRAFTDDFDTTNGAVGAKRKGRNKRQRHSNDEDSDSESQSPGPSERDSDSAGEDDIDPRATQRVTNQLRGNEQKQNLPADNGIIEEIKCTNFMCHEQLTVTLGPLINFVIGHNGSGKSAVLTALTLCLGGKPGATNRGSSLKSFIKEGKDFSNLSVKIKNQGSSAYKPDTYGRSIIVERHFTRTGTSGFKIKDVNGKIVSNKKQELEDIIDAFALQIDNPMNVLTQDMARQFLNDSTPKDKYKFFLKGTQLETLSKDYELIKSQLDETEAKIEIVSTDIDVLRKRAQEALDKAKRAQSLETMRAKEKLILQQAAWARVQEEEGELANIDAEIDRVQSAIRKRNEEVEARSQAYQIADEAFSNANKDAVDRQADRVPLDDKRRQLESQMQDIKKAKNDVKASQRGLVSILESKDKSIKSYKKEIREKRKHQEEADNGQFAQKVRELEQAKTDCEEAQKAEQEHNEGLPALDHQLRDALSKKRTADEKVEEKRVEVRRAQMALRDLEQGQQSWIDAYRNSSNLKQLLREIQQERRFQQPPVGPMGRYVKLLKPEWSSILEKQSGASLNAFVVTSKADQALLSQLLRKTNYVCPIFIGQANPIDTSGYEPASDLLSWLKVLKFENDLVRNQMIINHSIDQVVLIPKRADAENFMHDGGARRTNVKMCFSFADGNPQKGHSITLNPNTGAIGLGPIDRFDGASRMQADKASQLSAAKSNLERLQADLRGLEVEPRSLGERVTLCQREVNNHKSRKRELLLRKQEFQRKVDELEDELNTATPDAGLIEQLEASLQKVQEEKTFAEEQYQDTVLEMDKVDTQAANCKSALEDVQRDISQLNVELGKANTKADKMKSKREADLREMNKAHERARLAEENKAEWEHKRGEKLVIVEDIRRQANEICSRVEVPAGATSEGLIKKRETMIKTREETQRSLGGSEDDLYSAATTAKRMFKEANEALAGHREISRWLKNSLSNRQNRWERFRQDISVRARITFTYLLSERQFRGGLKVNHTSKQLDIQVQPDITVVDGVGRQTKTLSGGEKSFSTICLLLSLWDAMGSPIRCLDEFDVFMDNVNRDISMKMMIGAARRAIGRQYILITPQAMNSVQSVADVKIIKMNDPIRGQTALPVRR